MEINIDYQNRQANSTSPFSVFDLLYAEDFSFHSPMTATVSTKVRPEWTAHRTVSYGDRVYNTKTGTGSYRERQAHGLRVFFTYGGTSAFFSSSVLMSS